MTPSASPIPFLIDRSITSLVMFTARPLSPAVRRRGLPLMSPPPRRAETVISLMTFVHSLDFLASDASFLCLIFDQRLCPDMHLFLPRRQHRREARRYGAAHPGVAGRGRWVQLAA